MEEQYYPSINQFSLNLPKSLRVPEALGHSYLSIHLLIGTFIKFLLSIEKLG